jgi:hypothetical protein
MRAMSCAAAAVLFSACWSAPRPAAPRQDLPIALTVEQAELANGLKVVVVPEPSVGEVSVTIRYAVGSADDPEDRAGLAHLVEHLLFENVRDGEALFDALERRALAFNGFTLPDATIYTERGMLGQLEELLELETARLVGTCTAIPEAAFVRQREIVRNELRERAVDDDVQAALNTALFAAPRKTATAETIDAITQDEACSLPHGTMRRATRSSSCRARSSSPRSDRCSSVRSVARRGLRRHRRDPYRPAQGAGPWRSTLRSIAPGSCSRGRCRRISRGARAFGPWRRWRPGWCRAT